jgi:predicted nuclease with TOPRIM domain
MERQLTVNKNNPESFFSRIQDILNLYNLPPIYVLVDALPTKLAWKRGINLNIAEKWTNKLSEEVEGKSSMKLCNRDILKIHDVHSVWSSLPAVTREVKKAQIKARLLTGTYLLQSDMQRFSKEKDEQKCELWQIEQENMEHFLLRCPALNEKRKITPSKLKQTLIQSTGQDKWTETIVGNKTLLLQTIIDVADELNINQETFKEIEMISRNLCYDLHVQRTLLYRRIKLAG